MKSVFCYLSPKSQPAWRAATVPFLLGPVVLTIMYIVVWKTSFPGFNQRGLFEFHSATIGDFILLPTTWTIMSRYYSLIGPNRTNKKPLLIFFIVGISILLSGILTLSSMYGANRDWTLPSYGTINFPGIYHSVFMGFMIAIYALFIADHWRLFSHTVIQRELVEKCFQLYWILLNLLTIFMSLLWSDAYYKTQQPIPYLINPIQQLLWAFFIVVNIVLTIKSGNYPKNKIASLVVKQTVFLFLIFIAGYFLSISPLLWNRPIS